MNRLKLLFPFLITLFILVSCSSDDNSVMNSNSSKLVGVWKPVKEVSACTNGIEYMDEYNTCEQKSRVSFFSDGTYKYIAFDNDEGECIENNFVETGTWSLNGEILTAVKDENNEDDDDDDYFTDERFDDQEWLRYVDDDDEEDDNDKYSSGILTTIASIRRAYPSDRAE